MSKVSEEQYLTLLHSCADNCSAPYCFFKMFLEHQHPDLRVLCQIKCIEMLKWERSEKAGHELKMDEIAIQWCSEGWARAFAQVYEEGVAIRDIYYRTKTIIELQKMGILNVSNASSQTSTTVTTEINKGK